MLDSLFGSKAARNVLLYLQAYGEGHGAGIATTFGIYPTSVSNQLGKLEVEGLLVSRLVGRTRMYCWNPRNPLVPPLRKFLQAVLEALPEDEVQAYFRQRRRPRRAGKPL